jgi:hypothetical protein
MKRETFYSASYVFYGLAILAFGAGLSHLWLYRNDNPLYSSPINAYVQGDAYNYIINAGKSTAHFAMATFFGIIGMGCTICNVILAGKSLEGVKEEAVQDRQAGA